MEMGAPSPRKLAGGEGRERVGPGATKLIRSLLCPSPCQPILQVNYFPGQNSRPVTTGLRPRSQAVWEMMSERPLTFPENGLVQPGTIFLTAFS